MFLNKNKLQVQGVEYKKFRRIQELHRYCTFKSREGDKIPRFNCTFFVMLLSSSHIFSPSILFF